MTISVGYMGTKRQLAPLVSELVASTAEGPFLDIFSGICAVGEAIGDSREVWTNDAQYFSYLVGKSHFTAKKNPPTPAKAYALVETAYSRNKLLLEKQYQHLLNKERKAFLSDSIDLMKAVTCRFPHVNSNKGMEKSRSILNKNARMFPFRLFSITYAGGYFSLKQSIEIDSIRYAIHTIYSNRTIDHDTHNWMLLGLCQAASKVSRTTGHFAQFLKINDNNAKYFSSQYKRNILYEWIKSFDELRPLGNLEWRKHNKAFNAGCNNLLHGIEKLHRKPATIYADPPYKADQYSRYYHIYETILFYDYPMSIGVGRYRPDRFRSSFSVKSEVTQAFQELFESIAGMKSTLILSYPSNGLVPNAREKIYSLLRSSFSKVEIAKEISYQHSSLGSSTGKSKHPVTELLFLAR